jgi:hypothetical protein
MPTFLEKIAFEAGLLPLVADFDFSLNPDDPTFCTHEEAGCDYPSFILKLADYSPTASE